MTPIQRDTERKKTELAMTQASVLTHKTSEHPHAKAMRYKLNDDVARLKKIASMQAKASVKAEILPEYLPYIEGLMTAGGTDDVLTWCMIWAWDAGQIELFEKLARYALTHNAKMPTGFDRPLGGFLAETVAKWTLKQFDEDEQAQPTRLALWLLDATATTDMHDEIRAKLYVASACLVQANQPDLALNYYETALTFDSHIRVKRKIKAIKESQSPQGQAANAVVSAVLSTALAPVLSAP